jgi:hypothetical protein
MLTDNYTCKAANDQPTHRIVDGQVCQKIVVHCFTVSDVDDPDIYAAGPLFDWERSEVGQWVFKNAIESPIWQQQFDLTTYGHKYVITAWLKEQDITYYCLRWK